MKPEAPKKRYTTTIVIDHHSGQDLADVLHGIWMNYTIDWDRSGGMPYSESVGGHRVVRHVENDGYVPEADYYDALMAWWQASRSPHNASDAEVGR